MSAEKNTSSPRPVEGTSNGDAARQPTNDPALSDPEKTPGSGMLPDDAGDAPTG